MRRAAIALGLLAAGCTVGPGEGFGTLRDVELSAHLEDGAEVTTDLGYAVTFREVVIEVDHLVLQDVLGGEGAPAGDDGHAHGDEEPAVDDATAGEPVALAGAEVAAELDVLSAEVVEVEGFEPSTELPFGAIRRVLVAVHAVRLEAAVEGPGLAEPLTLRATLPLELELAASTLRELDRDHGHDVSAAVEVALAPGLLDGVAFSALADGPELRWEDPAAPGAATLLEALAASGLHVTFDAAHDREGE